MLKHARSEPEGAWQLREILFEGPTGQLQEVVDAVHDDLTTMFKDDVLLLKGAKAAQKRLEASAPKAGAAKKRTAAKKPVAKKTATKKPAAKKKTATKKPAAKKKTAAARTERRRRGFRRSSWPRSLRRRARRPFASSEHDRAPRRCHSTRW